MAHRTLKILCVAGCLPRRRPRVGECSRAVPDQGCHLLSFARYVEWPANACRPARRCGCACSARRPFGEALSALEGRQVNGHEVKPRVVDGVEMASDSPPASSSPIGRAARRAAAARPGRAQRAPPSATSTALPRLAAGSGWWWTQTPGALRHQPHVGAAGGLQASSAAAPSRPLVFGLRGSLMAQLGICHRTQARHRCPAGRADRPRRWRC